MAGQLLLLSSRPPVTQPSIPTLDPLQRLHSTTLALRWATARGRSVLQRPHQTVHQAGAAGEAGDAFGVGEGCHERLGKHPAPSSTHH